MLDSNLRVVEHALMKLADYLHDAGRTEADLASEIGCSQGTVNKIKLGKQWPGPDLMRRIAAATGGMVMPNDFADLVQEKDGEAA